MEGKHEITINYAKNLLHSTHRGTTPRLVIKDVSRGSNFGYTFGVFLATWREEEVSYWSLCEEPLLKSHEVYYSDMKNKRGTYGAFRAMFYKEDIERLIQEVKS